VDKETGFQFYNQESGRIRGHGLNCEEIPWVQREN